MCQFIYTLQASKERQEVVYERVSFGEVAHAPPTLHFKSKGNTAAPRVSILVSISRSQIRFFFVTAAPGMYCVVVVEAGETRPAAQCDADARRECRQLRQPAAARARPTGSRRRVPSAQSY